MPSVLLQSGAPKVPPSLSGPVASTGVSQEVPLGTSSWRTWLPEQPFIFPHLHSSSQGPHLVNHLHDPFCGLSQKLACIPLTSSLPVAPSLMVPPCCGLPPCFAPLVVPSGDLTRCLPAHNVPFPGVLLAPATSNCLTYPARPPGFLGTQASSDYPPGPTHHLDFPASELRRGSLPYLEFPSLESADAFKKP